MTIQIKSISQLKNLAIGEKQLDCFIDLSNGLRSSKDISYNGKGLWDVFHSISGTTDTLTDKELLTQTNIGKAIKSGRFFCNI